MYTSYWKDQDGFITDYSVVRHEVNLTYVGDDEIGRVIHDLLCPDGKRMYSRVLGGIMDYLKTTKEGYMEYQSDIGKILQRGMEKGIQKGKRETVEMLLRKKLLTPDQIAENLDFPLSEVLEIEKSIG